MSETEAKERPEVDPVDFAPRQRVVDLDPIVERLEGGCAVRRTGDKLHVLKLGEMYLIKQSGQIVGEGALRDRIEEVVDELADNQEVEG